MADMDPQGVPSPEPANKPAAGNDSQPTRAEGVKPTPRWIPPPRTLEQRMGTTVRQRWARRLCLSLLLASTIALPQTWAAQDQVNQEQTNMPSLAQMIDHEQWDDAYAYVRRQQNAIVPEVRAIVSDPRTSGTAMEIAYGFLRKVPTLESATLLAQGLGKGGGRTSVFGLIENPRPEVYPILKAKLQSPKEEENENLLLTMAQIPVPPEQRIADMKPYVGAKDYGVRVGAVFGLALLDDPGSMELMARALGSGVRGKKEVPLMIFYQFRAWRTPKFVPVLIPVLNDPMEIKDIGLRRYNADGSESAMTPEELRYLRARDYALNILVKTLNIDVPFKIEEDVTYSKEQRELVKQKLRDLGYTVTDEPYAVTTGV
ncbi:hypothetical protein [Cupriavidus basilensis]|uniref:HEAT repeat domain-containing protein n=1 Tax=Cupriavidus basilensis TaxID=68895 RepID=A0A7M2H430_9BURK|nr:hypothetical protein [Cupriavidus basilensis]QOT78989.1 hypothetical protein F7R26_029870 [Cupriavidus basilensis]